jgi:glycosyltransferase involved in cell wall biosynthesis
MSLDPIAGGVQRTTWQLGHYFAQQGWEVLFISLALDGHKTPLAGSLHFPSEDINGDSRLLKRFLASTFQNQPPDVVINHTELLSVSDKVLFELRQTEFSYRIVSCFRNNPSMFKDNHRSLVRHLLRNKRWFLFLIDHPLGWRIVLLWHRLKNRHVFYQVLSRCDRYMLLSPTFISELRWYVPGLDQSKIVIIPNAFQMPDISVLPTKRKHLLFVGRLEQAQKNILMLPNIWQKVQHRLPEWELHIVGDGPDRAELESKIEKVSLERIYLHGKMDPTDHYRAAKVFLMVSFFEGFGNTLIEAQMHGVVPVAFRSYSAVEWMLNDGVDAVLVPPFDVDRYANALVQLATDEDRWTCMSAAAVSNAQRFSEKVVGDIWFKVLSDVMNEPLVSS